MQSTNPFLVKFASSIIAVLGCKDRVLFKGYLPFADEAHLNRFVDHTLRIRRKHPKRIANSARQLVAPTTAGK